MRLKVRVWPMWIIYSNHKYWLCYWCQSSGGSRGGGDRPLVSPNLKKKGGEREREEWECDENSTIMQAICKMCIKPMCSLCAHIGSPLAPSSPVLKILVLTLQIDWYISMDVTELFEKSTTAFNIHKIYLITTFLHSKRCKIVTSYWVTWLQLIKLTSMYLKIYKFSDKTIINFEWIHAVTQSMSYWKTSTLFEYFLLPNCQTCNYFSSLLGGKVVHPRVGRLTYFSHICSLAHIFPGMSGNPLVKLLILSDLLFFQSER